VVGMLVIPKLEIQAGAPLRGQTADGRSADAPVAAARVWAAEGYGRLLVADRDAVAGRRPNYNVIESLARDVGAEIDVAAGADSADKIEAWIDSGATRIVLGGRALAEDDWLRSTADSFPGILMVETSTRERRVTTRGWVRTLSIDLVDLVEDLAG